MGDGVSPATLDQIAALLRPELALPGERIVERGTVGKMMYFVSTGAVRVGLDSGAITLGTGDFFGELALLTDQPRVADVDALTYCDLLMLHREDFHTVMAGDTTLKETIRRVAAERLGPDTTLVD